MNQMSNKVTRTHVQSADNEIGKWLEEVLPFNANLNGPFSFIEVCGPYVFKKA